MSFNRTYEQFIKFTTDYMGVERILRLFHAVALILSSYTWAFDLLAVVFRIPTIVGRPTTDTITTKASFAELAQRLNYIRRYFRLFRSFEFFYATNSLYAGLAASQLKGLGLAVAWLDVFSRAFMSLYLVMDASLILDASQIPGLRVWSLPVEKTVMYEGNRFWVFSLSCGILSGVLKLVMLLTATPSESPSHGGSNKTKGPTKNASGQKVDEQASTKKVSTSTSFQTLSCGVVVSTLDMLIPCFINGWVRIDAGALGTAMLVTTILTIKDVWDRCGRQMAA